MSQNPLWISRCFLDFIGVETTVLHRDRIPCQGPVLLVSNHRSFMDPALLMDALGQSVHFACHPYMAQVPVLADFVREMGGFSLTQTGTQPASLFQTVSQHLSHQRPVGLFPEGAAPMVRFTHPQEISPFQRGFAHLALRTPVEQLHILPMAIAAQEESQNPAVPLQLLSLFDPTEPLFAQSGWHPAIVYRKVQVSIGHPCTITAAERQAYQGRAGRSLAQEITATIERQVSQMLAEAA